ncbi:MAG TPA: SRPBCC domain-containing protein, partial [Methanoculleus sp.]|nr:SRPBCC domain-containing protein [Methanoculleus sp.]
DVTPPERLVYTFEFEGEPGRVALDTVVLEDLGGRTKVTDRTVFQSAEDRDGMLLSGMREGAVESMDRFAELLNDLQNG